MSPTQDGPTLQEISLRLAEVEQANARLHEELEALRAERWTARGLLAPLTGSGPGDFSSSVSGTPAVKATGTNGADGVDAISDSGIGVSGGSGTGIGVEGTSNSGAGIGVQGRSPDGIGVFGDTQTGVGVVGQGQTGVTGEGRGNGAGVFGNSHGGTGVRGESVSGTGVSGGSGTGIGVEGTSNSGSAMHAQSETGTGVSAQSRSGTAVIGSSGSGTGVFGTSSSGTGVFGTSGTGIGVFAQSSSGIGVSAESTSGTGMVGSSSNGTGVRGTTANGAGVVGRATTSNGVGVVGENGGGFGSFAGFFAGNVEITGFLLKAGGLFRIDHPLDPAHKFLLHSFVESPDMKNIYDGVVVLDVQGEAEVTLPSWFDALNTDFRYQLTPIGAAGPDLYIAEEIRTNRFKIAGGKPRMKVSWQVTGIRQDAWAKANPLPVEQEKPEQEQGYYLHPELYGESEQRSIVRLRYPELKTPVLPEK